MQVYDPTAPSQNAAQNLRRPLGDLNGKVVGFIDNAKPNFNLLIDDLSALLASRYGVKSVITRRKRGPSMPAAGEVFDELAAQCDLVITGSGD
ncbi:MAG: hypothetical protein ABL891_20840 [Burkholderiales bacterium]